MTWLAHLVLPVSSSILSKIERIIVGLLQLSESSNHLKSMGGQFGRIQVHHPRVFGWHHRVTGKGRQHLDCMTLLSTEAEISLLLHIWSMRISVPLSAKTVLLIQAVASFETTSQSFIFVDTMIDGWMKVNSLVEIRKSSEIRYDKSDRFPT